VKATKVQSLSKKRKSEETTGQQAKMKNENNRRKMAPSGDEKVNPNVGQKLDDDLRSYLDQKFGELDEKYDERFDNLEKKVGNLEKMMIEVQKDVKLLLSVSPEVGIQRINPVIVGTEESNRMAVLEGGESTWSYLRSENSLWAVGSVHCGLYYGSMHPTLTFVNLPAEVVNLGVLEIGFLKPYKIGNPIQQEYDIMLLKLKQNDVPNNPAQIHKYEAFDPHYHIQKLAGKSNSGIVSGKNIVVDKGHLVFVEDFGESGNSGTLMFGWGNDIDKAKPVGVYHGVRTIGGNNDSRNSIPNGLRPRGIVAPLPDPKEITWFQVLRDEFPAKLQVIDRKGIRDCNIVRNGERDAAACLLIDGKDWLGVLLKFQAGDKIQYCGSMDSGSRRCM
jgi:hypothetical protein